MIKYHFKPLDKCAEVGVFLVVGDEGRLYSLSGTFNVHTRPIHLGQIHPLQVPQAPEQNLRDGEVQRLCCCYFRFLTQIHFTVNKQITLVKLQLKPSLHLNSVLAEHWSDPQWYREDWATVHICGTVYGRQVSFPIGANLTDETRKHYKSFSFQYDPTTLVL